MNFISYTVLSKKKKVKKRKSKKREKWEGLFRELRVCTFFAALQIKSLCSMARAGWGKDELMGVYTSTSLLPGDTNVQWSLLAFYSVNRG